MMMQVLILLGAVLMLVAPCLLASTVDLDREDAS